MTVIAGGLGGGGDLGLALVLLKIIGARNPVIVSFSRCNSARLSEYKVRGSLVRPSFYHPRNLEYSLMLRAPRAKVYAICTRDRWDEIQRAIDYVIEAFAPECWLSSDIGGDGVLSGYESMLGSWKTDTIARASIAYASREHGVKGIIAIGGLGLEGGNKKALNMEELTATLLLHREHNALVGIYKPRPEDVDVAESLLTGYDSRGRKLEFVTVMLRLYIAAVRGRKKVIIDKGYSIGLHVLEWWHPYIFFIDALKGCIDSPLCKTILKEGKREKIEKPFIRYSGRYRRFLGWIRRKGFEQVLRDLIQDYLIRDTDVKHICQVSVA